jgi:hypothetical protein
LEVRPQRRFLNKPEGGQSDQALVSKGDRDMKTAVLTAAVVSIAAASIIPVHAGDREWSTAGKVLTGVFAAGVIAEAFRPHCPPPVVYAHAPVVYAPVPVVYAPAPVVYAPAAVVYSPATVV